MRRLQKIPVPFWLLAGLFVIVSAWAATWPDHPLFPDEAVAKVMVDSVARTGSPFAHEPFTSYPNGAFAPDPYSSAYAQHTLSIPPTNIATSYEQGLLTAKIGRIVTLAVGVAGLAYIAASIAGPWAGLFAGSLYLTNAGVLFYHQSYFANMGGASWFIASLALLQGSRHRPSLARFSALAGAIAVAFRVEYALGFVALAAVAWLVLPGAARIAGYYATCALLLAVLWNLDQLFPSVSQGQIFTETLPLPGLLHDPISTIRGLALRYHDGGQGVSDWRTFVANTFSYFPFFFPLIGILAILGLFARVQGPRATWVYVPLAAQSLLQGWAVGAGMRDFYWSNLSWVESSLVRYFLATYAFMALLAGVGLATLVPYLSGLRVRTRRLAPAGVGIALALLVCTASIATAWSADRGLAWANERKGWFDDIDATAAGLGGSAVIVGTTPSKVILSRPVLDPTVASPLGTVDIALDLMSKGHRVLGLEPWFWSDEVTESIMLGGAHTYWTDTGVQVDCTCGEFARFYELHATNATIQHVARLEGPESVEDARGLRTNSTVFHFYPERSLHVRLGLGETKGVRVVLGVRDEAPGAYDVGYWNLPLSNEKDRHPLASWTSNGSGEERTIGFDIAPDEIMNGAFYLRGPPGLVIETLEVVPK